MRRRMAFAALAARRAIATSSRIADIPVPSMAFHARQSFGAVRMLSPSSSRHRREAALGLGAKRFLSSSGEGEFEDAVVRSKSISNPGNDTLLSLYALFKQANHGPCDTTKPGMFDPVGAAKWTAWNKLGDMSKDDAKAAYIKIVNDSSPATSSPQAEAGNNSELGKHPGVPGLISVNVASTGVATVLLDSVTMPPAMFIACGKMFRSLGDDPAVKVIIVRAGTAKPHFSYGLDFKQAGAGLMKHKMDGPRHPLHKLIRDWQEGFTAIAECRAPVIAAVDGWCIGAGLDLISAADVRLCTRDAKISLREAAIGIVADLGSINRMPSIVGDSNARMMALTACDLTSDKALRMGLVSEVYDTADELYAAAKGMAETMAQRDPNCMMGIKEVMNRAREPAVKEGLEYVAAWNSAHIPLQDLAKHFLKEK